AHTEAGCDPPVVSTGGGGVGSLEQAARPLASARPSTGSQRADDTRIKVARGPGDSRDLGDRALTFTPEMSDGPCERRHERPDGRGVEPRGIVLGDVDG